MDSYEATKMVFSRIQSLDPENASKIMGYLLLQDHGDKEMIRLAFGPEALLHNLILQAKTHLGFSSNTPSTPSTPSSPSPFNPTSSSSRPSSLSISSSRIISSNNNGFDITNPSSPSTNSWPLLSPNSTSSLSYASIVNGTSNNNSNTGSSSLSSTMSLSNAFPYYNSNSCANNNTSNDLIDEYQLQDHFPFLNDSKTDDLFDPRLDLAMSPTAYGDTHLHRRSFSVPGLCFGSEDANSGLGWKPCLYFARGFCKNGTSCRFLHGGESGDGTTLVGSPSKLSEFEQCHELLRSKAAAAAAQQQKLAAASQFMTGASFPYNKCMNLLLQQQNDTQRSAAAAALMMGDELHKFGRCRPERNDFSAMGLAMNPGSRQIYLTFPADSTFREEDVSNYFSIYGPVQDVRIPYQQKRMFGFVTFVYPDTVKLILAKGNPHFVCDSRVLVKPYKEKGKVPDKYRKQPHQQQQIERGEYSACSSPSGLDSREPFDLHLGARMFQNTQEMLLRRKLEEQAELQQAIELQGRRLMNLQLLEFKNNNNHHQFLHGLSAGSPIPSPTLSRTPNSQTLIFQPDGIDQEVPEENGNIKDALASRNGVADGELEVNPVNNHSNGNSNSSSSTEEKSSTEENDLHESLEHILPDNLFTSPKKSAGDHTVFSTTALDVDDNAITSTTSSNSNLILPTTSTLNMTSLKSCFLQMPRFSSGHGTIGM